MIKAQTEIMIVKLVVLGGALGLDTFGHLDGPLTQLLTVAVGALGLTSVVTAYRTAGQTGPTASSTAMLGTIGELATNLGATYLQQLQTQQAHLEAHLNEVHPESVPPPAPPSIVGPTVKSNA